MPSVMAFLSIEHPKVANQGLLLDINQNKNILDLKVQTILGDVKGNIRMGYDGKKLIVFISRNDGSNEIVHVPITKEE